MIIAKALIFNSQPLITHKNYSIFVILPAFFYTDASYFLKHDSYHVTPLIKHFGDFPLLPGWGPHSLA